MKTLVAWFPESIEKSILKFNNIRTYICNSNMMCFLEGKNRVLYTV
jgi:hypothetical protein